MFLIRHMTHTSSTVRLAPGQLLPSQKEATADPQQCLVGSVPYNATKSWKRLQLMLVNKYDIL